MFTRACAAKSLRHSGSYRGHPQRWTHCGRSIEKRSLSPDLALDYVVRKELLGKATAAQVEASKVWGVSVGTVKDAFTDHGASATYRLKELVDSRVGKLERGTRNPDGSHTEILWTRERLLRAVLDDLQDYRRETRSRKSR